MRRLSPLALASLMVTGCGGDPSGSPTTTSLTPPAAGSFRDHTATVLIDTRTVAFHIDACGLDGQTFRVTGQGRSGETLEVEVEVEDDDATAVVAASGIAVTDTEQLDWSAFGDDAWDRRDRSGEPPGEITSGRVNGPLVQLVGQIAVVDEDEQPIDDESQSFSLDAYCDEEIEPAP